MNTHHSTQTSYSSRVLDVLTIYDGNYKASVAEVGPGEVRLKSKSYYVRTHLRLQPKSERLLIKDDSPPKKKELKELRKNKCPRPSCIT